MGELGALMLRSLKWVLSDVWAHSLLVFQAGMEMYARWAHKHIWHDMEAAWALHKSHHEPRTGPFEVSCHGA